MKLLYIFNCGCVFTKDKFKSSSRYLCPEHKESLLIRVAICESCNTEVVLPSNGGLIPNVCSACLSTPLFFRDTSCYKWQFDDMRDETRWDCKNRSDCLKIYSWFNSMPCKYCRYYKPRPLKKDVYKTKTSYKWGEL